MRSVGPLVAAAALIAGCSSGKGSTADPSSGTVGSQSPLPGADGYDCADPTGDIGSDVKGVGTKTEPAGIDITRATAVVDADSLSVTYTMAGPIAAAPSPFFVMLQGDASAPDVTFDLRTEPSSPGGPWVLKVGTTPKGGGVETFRQLTTPVAVEGDVLRYRVPLADLPPIATLQWTFGASSTQADNSVLFDDCSSIPQPTTDTTPPIVTVPPSSGG